MKRIAVAVFFTVLASRAVDCDRLEKAFAAMDAQYRTVQTVRSPLERYDYYYRYLSKGAELMAWCRNDRRTYQYTEIVRKLRIAERDRTGVRQEAIEELWRIHNVKPIVNVVYQTCNY